MMAHRCSCRKQSVCIRWDSRSLYNWLSSWFCPQRHRLPRRIWSGHCCYHYCCCCYLNCCCWLMACRRRNSATAHATKEASSFVSFTLAQPSRSPPNSTTKDFNSLSVVRLQMDHRDVDAIALSLGTNYYQVDQVSITSEIRFNRILSIWFHSFNTWQGARLQETTVPMINTIHDTETRMRQQGGKRISSTVAAPTFTETSTHGLNIWPYARP